MSVYGLNKITNLAMRTDSNTDLERLNHWRKTNGLDIVFPKKKTLRCLEDTIALGLKDMDISDLPPLVRGKDFYLSIIKELETKKKL